MSGSSARPPIGWGVTARHPDPLSLIGPAAIQSRAEAALCNRALVFLLPGSTGAVRLALDKILLPQLDSRTKPCSFALMLASVQPNADPGAGPPE